MANDPVDPPTSPRSRRISEKEKLQSTDSFVEVKPDPTSPRTRRASERRERLGSGEFVSPPVSPRTKHAIQSAVNEPSVEPCSSASRTMRTRRMATEPVPNAPPPKRARNTRNSIPAQSPQPAEQLSGEKQSKKKENSAEPCKSQLYQAKSEKMMLKSGIVPLQFVFGDEKTRPTKREMEETLALLKSVYPTIREEYDESVDSELSTGYMQHIGCSEDDNLHRKNLHSEKFTFPKMSFGVLNADQIATTTRVTWIKPDVNVHGENMKRIRVACSRIEVGDIRPAMNYWVPIEQNITTKDKRRLTHMPYFEDGQDDNNINQQMFEVFSEGIHGVGDNWNYINDWILYKMFRKVLEGYSGIPDVLYYTLYRLWPNKLTQSELSDEFPKLCERFAEVKFDVGAAEPWKEKPVQMVARNLKNTECYSCLSYMCPIHGFRAEIAPDFPGGDFYQVTIPLPNPEDKDYCSGECWKKSDTEKAVALLKPQEDELNNFSVTAHLDKGRLARMEAEEGLLATMYAVNSTIPFCEFAAKSVFADDEDLRIRSCRAAYEFILTVAEHPSEARIALTKPAKRLDIQARVQMFRRDQQKKCKEKERHRINEEERKEKHEEAVRMELVTPITACRHSGPCGSSADNCSCSENGICSYLCMCDVNCPQRFPGCNCAPGQCQTKRCQCFRARWECNPLTCGSCQCDVLDSTMTGCSNYAMTRLVSKRLICAPSRIAGNGLFLLDGAEKDEFITEYVGERITDDEAERRGAIYDRYQTSYIFNLETGGAIDSYKVGNLARFANHDEKNPTCYARTMVVAGEHRIGFYAKYKLEPNTELTFDYSYSGEHQKVFKRPAPKSTNKNQKNQRQSNVKSN